MPTVAKRQSRPAAARARLSLSTVMELLEQAGSEQTRKTYRRHGAPEPLFGVSFATLKALLKQIGVDHELALALWETGNYDARNLALKIADPAQMDAATLDRWARTGASRSCKDYVAALAGESGHGRACAQAWLGDAADAVRAIGWSMVGVLAMGDAGAGDEAFLTWLADIERDIHAVGNGEREAMNLALIAIGSRNPALRGAATEAAHRIGKVQVDHGDTACKTPDAASYIDKTWAHSLAKGYASPAEHERAREPLRLRC